MDHTFDLPAPARELLSRIERDGSALALSDLTDAELAQWAQTCQAMAQRGGRASGAQRTWRRLLTDARTETNFRQLDPRRDRYPSHL